MVALMVVQGYAPGIGHRYGIVRALGFGLLLGIAAGVEWYRLHPRTLANPLAPLTILAVLSCCSARWGRQTPT